MKTTTQNSRPFQAISTAMLTVVVNRGRYTRYGREFENALQAELLTRQTNRRVS